MGVVRLLCITIAFAFLATVAAQDCSSNGARVGGRCVCKSGFAGALCENQNPGACFASIHTPQNLKDNWFPNLVQEQNGVRLVDNLAIAFKNNVLSLNINGELVSQRTYTDINFINNLHTNVLVNDTRCSLNGGNSSFWTQSNQVAELPQTDLHGNQKYAYRCGDLFTLAMPWDQHSQCGFSANSIFEATDKTYHQYEAIIKMNYDDVLDVFDPESPPNGDGSGDDDKIHESMTRHASVSYTIYVKFTKVVEVNVTEIVVFSQVNLTVVLTQFEYDPATSSATMTFASIVRYPHIAVRNFTTIEIPHMSYLSFGAGSGNPVNGTNYVVHPETDPNIRLDPATDVCEDIPTDFNNPPKCMQRFTTKVYLGTGSCNFDGTYIFGTLVSTCRDSATYRTCPSEMQFVGLKLANSGVCGAVTAEPQVTGELVAMDKSGTVTNEFLVGSRAFFSVKVNTRNSFRLKWLDIFTISVDDTSIWDMNDKIPDVKNLTYVRPPHAQYFVKDARLQYNNFFTSSHPNSDASFDPAKYPKGPVDINGWQEEKTITGHLTDGAVVLGPNFDFRWDGGIFTPGINKKKVYNVIAKAQLTFEGNEAENRKREVKIVDFVYKPETSGVTANILCGLMAEETVAPASEAVTSSSVNMVAVKAAVPVAGVALVVVAVAIIAAVVIVRRKKNTSTFRTLN